MTSLTALRLLLQGYLNYDWPDEYDDPRMAVDDFARSEPALARVLSGDVEHVIANANGESQLRRVVVDELGSGYLPEADDWTYLQWLKEVVRRVEDRLKG
jgi:hypothetical protein